MKRTIREIAFEIKRKWTKPYFGAVPYIDAMTQLESINDSYFYDSGRSIVNYFLSNASKWKGEDAKRLKQELKNHLNEK